MNVSIIGTLNNFLNQVKKDREKIAELVIEKMENEVFYSFSFTEDEVRIFLDENDLKNCTNDIEEYNDIEHIKDIVHNSITKLHVSGLIFQDMINYFYNGDNVTFEILTKDKDTLDHQKNIKLCLEGKLTAKVVSDTLKLYNNIENTKSDDLEILILSEELIQCFREEKELNEK